MNWIGIDIAKHKFDIAVVWEKKVLNKVFKNTPEGHQEMVAWLAKRDVLPSGSHVCMEATSQYYEALAEHLWAAGFRVSVVNPLRIKAFGEAHLTRQKTDKADATLIARFAEQHNPTLWQPAPPEIRLLQRLLARLEAVKQMQVQELNRQHLAAGEELASIDRTLGFLNDERTALEKRIRDHIDQHPDLRKRQDLLTSIPGVGEGLSSYFMAWLQPERFDDARQAAAFIGVTPQHRQSGSSVRGKSRLCKVGHARLRKMLYLPAMSAITHNPAARAFAERLQASGKRGKVVIAAVMRKLVHWMFAVLKSSTPFNQKMAIAKG